MPLHAIGTLGELIEAESAQLTRDRYGLSSAQAVWHFVGSWSQLQAALPQNGDAHPIFTFMGLERLDISKTARFWNVQGIYFGIEGNSTEPVYELHVDTNLEPIETHPDFEEFAGTSAAPLHGAKFDSDGIFLGFADPSEPDFCGVTSYLRSGALWTETYYTRNEPNDLNDVGEIDEPAGWQPNIVQSRNWLFLGLDYTLRGNCYAVRKTWKASGPLGWNAAIY